MLLHDVLKTAARDHRDRDAILFQGAATTYGTLESCVRSLAHGLRSIGIREGDRVAILLGNCPEFTVGYFGTTALGAVCVPANPLLKPAELNHIWADSNVKAIITSSALLPNVKQGAIAVPSARIIITDAATGDATRGTTALSELIRDAPDRDLPLPTIDENHPAVCIYTSGTTGRPKGALLSHRNLLENCNQIRQVLRFDASDNFLCVLPLFHSFAGTVCQNTPLFCGARATMLEQFSPARVLEAIEKHRVTIFAGVPAMFGALLHFPTDREYDLSSLRLCVSGGAPMPVALMRAFEDRFATIIIEGDGPTERSPVTSVNPVEGMRKPGSVGLPLPGVEIKIFDEQDTDCPTDDIGEIVVRGANVMLGYHKQPQETAEAMRSGWYHTGDLGRIDSDGYVWIVDRKKDMLLVGGFNVYPREVEEVLYTHPAVAEAAVIGAPDPLRGEEVVAVVALKPNQQATDRELIRFARERLANYKVPRRVLFRDSLPKGGTGKILKRLLRKELDLEA